MQNLHQEKDLEISALQERTGEERRRQVDKDDELEALREQLRHMERQRDRQDASVHPVSVPQLPHSNPIPQTAVQWWVKYIYTSVSSRINGTKSST